jgi:16S rRNA (guanine(1405)-N(7))-methyltransferase
VDDLVAAVRSSPKYRHVSVDLIRRLGTREMTARRNLKEAVKATKNALHQVAGAYLDGKFPYADWLDELAAAKAQEPQPWRDVCLRLLARHASCRERLAFLPEFYTGALADVQPVCSVLDIGCGLAPLAAPWLPTAEGFTYHACDIHEDMAAFLNGFFALAGIDGQATVCDVAVSPPTQSAHVAFVLKLLPLLDQWDKTASLRLLQTLQAEHILVSYPTRSLGGHSKGMAANYEARFQEIIHAENWRVRRFDFPTELCFLVTK